MRRIKKDDRTFKGSIFATFVDRDTADKFIKNEKSNIYQDKPLIKQFQDQYAEEKQKRSREQRIADKQAKQAKKLEQLVEQEKLSKQAKYEKGAILEINGLDPESTNFNELKTFFKQFGPVAFVAYEQGNETVCCSDLNPVQFVCTFRLVFASVARPKTLPKMLGKQP